MPQHYQVAQALLAHTSHLLEPAGSVFRIVLRVCYAIAGTDLGSPLPPMRSPVLTSAFCYQISYAMTGTDIGSAPIRECASAVAACAVREGREGGEGGPGLVTPVYFRT